MATIPSRASNDNATISAGVRLGVTTEVYTKRLEIALSGTRRERRARVLGHPTPRMRGSSADDEGAKAGCAWRLGASAVYIRRSKITISLEPSIWEAFQEIATEQGKTVSELVAEIERTRVGSLSAAPRLHRLLLSDHHERRRREVSGVKVTTPKIPPLLPNWRLTSRSYPQKR